MSESKPSSSKMDRRALLTTTGALAATTVLVSTPAHGEEDSGPSHGVAAGTPALRRPRRQVPQAGTEPTPNLGVIVFNRLALGPRPGDVASFDGLGNTPLERLTAWVDQQIDWQSIPDPVADAALSAANFTTLNKTRQQLWVEHIVANMDTSLPREEVIRATCLRGVYSERQLLEVMADFWHNHFNVYADRSVVRTLIANYDRSVIRPHVFGNFRQMLEDVAMSTSMLYYLDNYTSTNAGPNENFCRELLELMTLGAENYLGILPQSEVPTDGEGLPIGYVDADVFEAVRCFTGWSVDNTTNNGGSNDGSFLYKSVDHDRFQKNVLGVFIPQDQPPLKDGRDVLDALAAHPGTGRHIAGKLCRRLISDHPPQTVIDQAAALFTAQKDAPDQLAQVVRLIVLSNEFQSTWGGKTKRPFEIGIGALRAAQADFDFSIGDSDTDSMLSRLRATGHSIFRRASPDGFPDFKEAWESTTPRALSWKWVNWLIDVRDDDDNFRLDVLGATPPSVRTSTELADFWIDRILQRPMTPEDRQDIIEFMAQGFNPDIDLPLDTSSTIQDRLRSMVGLIFMTPNFLFR